MENENYTPVQPNFYKYQGLKLLKNAPVNPLHFYSNMYLCVYTVQNDGKYPFLKFLLTSEDYDYDNCLSFPELPVFEYLEVNDLKSHANIYLSTLLLQNELLQPASFSGFFEKDSTLFVFFDITNLNYQSYDIYPTVNSLWLTLIDEIVNTKHVCNILIKNDVTQLFIQNDDFCFLLDDKNESYEIPTVGYVGKEKRLLNFTYVFGECNAENNSIFGPYYYFTDYLNALEGYKICNEKTFLLTNQDDIEYIKGGIVRFAIFTGLVKYIENNLNDTVDVSERKKELLKNEMIFLKKEKLITQHNIEYLTLRITDYDGKWTENYDSVYLGEINLDNNTLYKYKNILVVKDLKQQTPLSHHIIDKNKE